MGNELVTIEAIGQRTIVGSLIFKQAPGYMYPVAMVPADRAKGLVESGFFQYAMTVEEKVDHINAEIQPETPAKPKSEKPKTRKTRTRKAKK